MFDKKLITLSIASALLTSSFASANTPDENDSVYEYGPWGQEFATAAGGEFNTNSLNFTSFTNNDSGRNGTNEPGFDSPQGSGACSAGSYCGFAEIYIIQGDQRSGGVDDVGYIDIDASPSHFSDGPYQSGLTGGFNISGNDGLNNNIDGMEGSHNSDYGSMYLPGDGNNESANIGYYSRPRSTGWYSTSSNGSGIHGSIYGGITTSLAQLNTFISNLNGPVARYNVEISDNTFNSYITIDFGDNSWDASFASSKEGSNGFTVTNGTVSGIKFAAGSDQLNAQDATVTGLVEGAIFGSKAQEVAGMIDIEKTYNGNDGSPIVRQALFRTVDEK